ncbi:hypothetical protein [Hymenobacter canadensis]|uniref:DUF5050 domain-containing protein n=1 Tax=Hymenobacter canadensis TaxID=2999067 RepID=A0ABY7LX05_9BACT|nr:hypothetical protein [Hymenobacter canadensis]WBA44124.1 hypothetical protein O3303_19740 [Hymenobacter canadensis]
MKRILLFTLTLLAFFGPARAQFTVQDVRIGDPTASYLDFEIWQAGNRLCFQDENNRGYVGMLDSQTGNLVSASGKDYLFDTALTSVTQSLNGPEWGYRVGGADVFYTKQIGTADKHIGQAIWNGTGYTATDLSASLTGRRFATICSKNPTDPAARLVYARGNNLLNFTIHWSAVANPVSDTPVPYGANSSSGPRFIEGEQALLTNDAVNGTTQIFRYDLATANLTQLTFDSGNKIDAFTWNAPDYGNARLLYCTVNDTILRLYRQVGSAFTPVYDVRLPDPSYGYYFSAEPFVFQNKSYLFVCAAARKFIPGSQSNSLPADVWVVALDPARPAPSSAR